MLWHLVLGTLHSGIPIISFLRDEFFFMMLNTRAVMSSVNVRSAVSADWVNYTEDGPSNVSRSHPHSSVTSWHAHIFLCCHVLGATLFVSQPSITKRDNQSFNEVNVLYFTIWWVCPDSVLQCHHTLHGSFLILLGHCTFIENWLGGIRDWRLWMKVWIYLG